ncbi:hypothetical protein Acr_02g0010020 [Actinidia rufa]|uniref:Retrotransposon gag domain-containing protein n=1 Tax=Actinidia rufa TaxID=165716 RepID=A0A7J0E900_9ERIC|nr:hypothetical protein Acr_02g0010020 [Actinidia rufa]
MANTNQAPDLEDLHREMHGTTKQIRIMNENNARLIQYLVVINQPPAIAPAQEKSWSSSRTPNTDGEKIEKKGRSPRHDDQAPKRQDKSTTQKIKDLDTRIDAINTSASALVTVEALIRVYEGKIDLMNPLDSYKNLMSLQGYSYEVMCKAFFTTLKGLMRSWLRKLSPRTIDSFGDLSKLFVVNFMSCRVRQKNASHLFTVHQKEGESLKDYIKRFNQTVLEVKDPNDEVVVIAMMERLCQGPLFNSLSKNVPKTLSMLQSKANNYIAVEKLVEDNRRKRGRDDLKRKEPYIRRLDYKVEVKSRRYGRDVRERINECRPRTSPH